MRSFLLLLAFFASASFSQTAGDLNCGTILSRDAQSGAITLSWWGASGRTYFVQQSEDLVRWRYVPIIEAGADSIITWGLASNAERLFFKVTHAEGGGGNPMTNDSDNDNISDWDEVQDGTNPFDTDSDDDGWDDDEEKDSGSDPLNGENEPATLPSEAYVVVEMRSVSADYLESNGQTEYTTWVYNTGSEEPTSSQGSWTPYPGWTDYDDTEMNGSASYSDGRAPPPVQSVQDAQSCLNDLETINQGWNPYNGSLIVSSNYSESTSTTSTYPPDGEHSNGEFFHSSYHTGNSKAWNGGTSQIRLVWADNAPRAQRLSPVTKTFIKTRMVDNVVVSSTTETLTLQPGQTESTSGGDSGGKLAIYANTTNNGHSTQESIFPVGINVVKEDEYDRPYNGLVVKSGDKLKFSLSAASPAGWTIEDNHVLWSLSQRKSDGTWGPWGLIPEYDGVAKGLRFEHTVERPGIFRVKARLFTATLDKEFELLRNHTEYSFKTYDSYGPGKIDEFDCFGVCETEEQVNYVKSAQKLLASRTYGPDRILPAQLGWPEYGTDNNSGIRCNIFVAHRATEVGINVPKINGLNFEYPPLANQWAGATDTKWWTPGAFDLDIDGWTLYDSASQGYADPQPGWLIAHPDVTDAGHCAIVDYDGEGLGSGSGSGTINKKYLKFFDGTSGYREYNN